MGFDFFLKSAIVVPICNVKNTGMIITIVIIIPFCVGGVLWKVYTPILCFCV